jgi:hypothetical protein
MIANKLTAVLKSGSRDKKNGDAATRGLANLARSLSKLGIGCAVVIILYSASTIQIAPVLTETAIQFLDATLCLLNPSIGNTPGMLKKASSCNATFEQLGIPAGQAPDPTHFVYTTRPPPVAIGFSFLCPAAVFLLYGAFYMYVLAAALSSPLLTNPFRALSSGPSCCKGARSSRIASQRSCPLERRWEPQAPSLPVSLPSLAPATSRWPRNDRATSVDRLGASHVVRRRWALEAGQDTQPPG